MKPHYQVPIVECGESLVPIPLNLIAVVSPHPYEKLGAPYGVRSPYFLRQAVAQALLQAQDILQAERPGWRLQVFDAYRPIAVQQFMVDYTLADRARSQGLNPEHLTPMERETLLKQVYQFWAMPSLDPATPPPHSTGAAIDLSLLDPTHQPIEMGSPIDEISERSFPNYFANRTHPEEKPFHRNRQLLLQVMTAAGFHQHPNEWWHFSFGDQMWAWTHNQRNPEVPCIARYGRVDG
ncbi:MAG: M15 family metallopeptidase [Leptolyngbyaceae cyanobacterium bins.59]|nr:M15 family metallopeptidase [Leptolyngbyaceae cyanobacterium bins.59]